MKRNELHKVRERRAARASARIFGTSERPRLSIFRSNRFMYAQIINDEEGKTIAAVSGATIKEKGNKSDVSAKIGEMIAEKAKAKGVKKVVFDRRGFRYHGRVKALADGARKGGLEF